MHTKVIEEAAKGGKQLTQADATSNATPMYSAVYASEIQLLSIFDPRLSYI